MIWAVASAMVGRIASVSPCRISCLRGATGCGVGDVSAEAGVDVFAEAEAESDVCWVRRRVSSSFFFVEYPLMPASLQRVRSSARDFLE